ncbi:MAG: acyl-CoA thioesterase [Firmicutes bacterium]|nr:acyl-CoA thioesterase [Bacillota bacterium]
MKRYKSIHMVRMEDLNHHQNLYAGRGTEWMIEASFIAACLEHGDKHGLLYKNTHKFNFMKSVEPGDIISYESTIVRTGKTSLTIHVYLRNEQTGEVHAEGYTTFVTVKSGTKEPVAHGICLDETHDLAELKWRQEAEGFLTKK